MEIFEQSKKKSLLQNLDPLQTLEKSLPISAEGKHTQDKKNLQNIKPKNKHIY